MNNKDESVERSSAIRLLIVDDEEHVCKGYQFELKYQYGITDIESMTDPEEALIYLEEKGAEGVDVVLLDLKMPHMDGLQMLSRIKDISEAIQVIVVSAFADNEEIKKVLHDIDVADIVVKPIKEFDNLVAKITKAGERKREIMKALRHSEDL